MQRVAKLSERSLQPLDSLLERTDAVGAGGHGNRCLERFLAAQELRVALLLLAGSTLQPRDELPLDEAFQDFLHLFE